MSSNPVRPKRHRQANAGPGGDGRESAHRRLTARVHRPHSRGAPNRCPLWWTTCPTYWTRSRRPAAVRDLIRRRPAGAFHASIGRGRKRACSESGRQIDPSSLREDAPCCDGGAHRPFPGDLWHGASTGVSAPMVRRRRADQATRARLREARDDRGLLRPGENHPPTQLLKAGRAFNALFTLPR